MIEANILLSGLGVECGGLAIAHGLVSSSSRLVAVHGRCHRPQLSLTPLTMPMPPPLRVQHNALTLLPETHSLMHGQKVRASQGLGRRGCEHRGRGRRLLQLRDACARMGKARCSC